MQASLFGSNDGTGYSLVYYFALPEGWEPSQVRLCGSGCLEAPCSPEARCVAHAVAHSVASPQRAWTASVGLLCTMLRRRSSAPAQQMWTSFAHTFATSPSPSLQVPNAAALALIQRFMHNKREFDGTPTRDRLKLIPRIVNVAEWAEKGPLSGERGRGRFWVGGEGAAVR